MGMSIYPVFQPSVPAAVFSADGKWLAVAFNELDDLALALGIAPFTSFGDNRPIPDDFTGDPDELDELLGPWDEWFSIEDGLHTIHSLIHAIENGHERAAPLPDTTEGVNELRLLADCLQVAQRAGARFRLELAS